MYIELHARSAFSFLEGSSLPEDLIATCAAHHQPAMALLDRDGIYGAPRFHMAAKKAGLQAHIGAEVACELFFEQQDYSSPQRHRDTENTKTQKTESIEKNVCHLERSERPAFPLREPFARSGIQHNLQSAVPNLKSPSSSVPLRLCGEKASRLPLLVASRAGYQNLCQLITRMKLRAKKEEGAAFAHELAQHANGLVCLTGGDEGPLAAALTRGGYDEALRSVEQLTHIFGRENVYVELQRHFHREEEFRNRAALDIAHSLHLPILATNGVHYATPKDRELCDVLTAIRHHQTLMTAGRLLARNSERHLKTAEEMSALFADLPEAIANTRELSARLDFTLKDLGYEFPRYPVPAGETMNSFLRQRTDEGARRRYGISLSGDPVPLSGLHNKDLQQRARRQLNRELALIEKLDLAGYFLIVWDLVRYCREQNILAQGRGSAANSAVCYALGITAVDPISMELLFERFLSEERGEWPDIDIDLPSGDQRERVIQYVYQRYGERGAAMTANVITYRNRMAAREMGKAMGFDPESLNKIAAAVATWEFRDEHDALDRRLNDAGLDLNHPRLRKYFELCLAVQDLPRHLGQHSGGMVICQGQLDSVVPLEPASMPGRVVVQWDKEDCADMGIIKVDLLGLGMMAVLEESIQLIRQDYKEEVDLAHLPPDDPAVYAGLQKADTIGLFQVESRAQMSCLPRLRPERFYDIVVQVAIIRPGPIVGQMVNPFLQRRQGREPVSYPHPSLEPVLKRTLGVPLFQEQLLRIAMISANFSGGEAEELRRAMGFKRSQARMKEIEARLRSGMTANGIASEAQEQIILSITSFALYGFPESHAASFALIAYASAWLKCHYLAAFTAALLNNQPMGFYHPATIVKDAQRHGLKVLPVDVMKSDWKCKLEPVVGRRSLVVGKEDVGSQRAAVRAQRSDAGTAASGPCFVLENRFIAGPGFQEDRFVSNLPENQFMVAPDLQQDQYVSILAPQEDRFVSGFVSGHGFSRADGVPKIPEGFSPCAPARSTASESSIEIPWNEIGAYTRSPKMQGILRDTPENYNRHKACHSERSEELAFPERSESLPRASRREPVLGTPQKPTLALRLGLNYVHGLREAAAQALVRERSLRPFESIHDLARRVPELRKDELTTLAEIGALNSIGEFSPQRHRGTEKAFGENQIAADASTDPNIAPAEINPSVSLCLCGESAANPTPDHTCCSDVSRSEESSLGARYPVLGTQFHRRDALWQVGRAVRASGPLLDGLSEPDTKSPLAPMTHDERLVADFHGTGLTVGPHAMAYRRAEMKALGIRPACELKSLASGQRVRIGGCVITRQRPGTAKGFLFLSLEDETGIANAIVRPDLLHRHRLLLIGEPFLMIEGILQNQDNVISVKAERVLPLFVTRAETHSHDFH
jgi:error-prone DNA polymerase